MDLNYLYYRHQLSLMHAAATGDGEARAAHRGLADLYASIINSARRDRPAGGPRAYVLARQADRHSLSITRSICDVARH